MKKLLPVALAAIFLCALPHASQAAVADAQSGKILLQVERNGEAWYVYPVNKLRYFLGRPTDAFSIMRKLGLGITTADLEKIPTSDSSATGDLALRQKLSGRILIQVQKNGEAWYVYPGNLKRYFLGRPADAFSIMRNLGLGADNENIDQIQPDRSFAPNVLNVREGGYAFAFYGLIGNGDAGSWNFVPYGTDSQPFEYSRFTRSLPCLNSLYWCANGQGTGNNTIYIGRVGAPGLSGWLGSNVPWLTERSLTALKTKNWNTFINVYLDEWLHVKDADGNEVYSGTFRNNFKVLSVEPFAVSSYHASLLTVRTSSYQDFYIRHKVVLLTKDFQAVYSVDYQTWTKYAESDTVLDRNLPDFLRTARTMTIL